MPFPKQLLLITTHPKPYLRLVLILLCLETTRPILMALISIILLKICSLNRKHNLHSLPPQGSSWDLVLAKRSHLQEKFTPQVQTVKKNQEIDSFHVDLPVLISSQDLKLKRLVPLTQMLRCFLPNQPTVQTLLVMVSTTVVRHQNSREKKITTRLITHISCTTSFSELQSLRKTLPILVRTIVSSQMQMEWGVLNKWQQLIQLPLDFINLNNQTAQTPLFQHDNNSEVNYSDLSPM